MPYRILVTDDIDPEGVAILQAEPSFDVVELPILFAQQRAGIETLPTVTTWDKSIMSLQADLLGAHALGVRSVVCTTGSPPVFGDYPAVDGTWEVDSVGLASLLAGTAGFVAGRAWIRRSHAGAAHRSAIVVTNPEPGEGTR